MKLLWVATKSPWPPRDGGRLLLDLTVRALVDAGHALTVIAPSGPDDGVTGGGPPAGVRSISVPARPRPLAVAWLRAQRSGLPATAERHALPAVRRAVAAVLERERFDAVVAEQAQALWAAEPAVGAGVALVLRAQNVESDLWAASATGPAAPLVRAEARRLARFEGEAVRRATSAVALSDEDAARLGELSGRPVAVLRAPFPKFLEPASRELPGAPALVVLGSAGWRPNERGTAWLLREGWPAVRRAVPGAVLHVYGETGGGGAGDGVRVVFHPAPADSRDAFAPGAVLVVPLFVGSGVRMKVLEAWARGSAVVATPAASRGLRAEPGRELLAFADPAGLVAAVRELADAGRRTALAAAGRALLGRDHDPARIAAAWTGVLAAAGGAAQKAKTSPASTSCWKK